MRIKEFKLNTFSACADAVVPALDKHHISIFNPAGSEYVLRLRKLFLTNLQLSAVTGVGMRFDMRRITGLSVGTDITPRAHDTAYTALPSGLLVKTGGTGVDGSLIAPLTVNNDEIALTGVAYDYQSINWLPEGEGMQHLSLRAGEGFSVRQITTSTVGSFGWLLIFTAERGPVASVS